MGSTVRTFDLDPREGVFDAFPDPDPKVDQSEGATETVVALSAARTGEPIEDVRERITLRGVSETEQNSKANITAFNEETFREEANTAVGNKDLGQLYTAEVTRLIKEELNRTDPSPQATDLLTTQGGDDWDTQTQLGLVRASIALKILDAKMERTDVGVLSIAGDIVDLLISAPIHGLTLAGFGRAEKIEKLRNQMSNPEISNKEFADLVTDTLNELDDAGVLQDTNFLFLSEAGANLRQGGLGTEATLIKTGALIDLAFVAQPALRLGATVVGKLRNTTRIASVFSGPEAAAAVLRDGVENPGSVASAASGVAEETTLGARRLPTNGAQPMVAPGARLTAEVERKGRIGEIFDELGFSKRVDPAVFEAWRPTAERRLSESLDTRQRNHMLDLFVSEPDKNGNVFGSIVLGTVKGEKYTDLNAAKRVLDLNGGEGAGHILTVVEGGVKRHSVVLTKNISSADLAKTLEIGEIGKFGISGIMIPFARAFGGNFLALPDRLTALALRGEGVATEAVRKITPILNKQLRALKSGEAKDIDQIFYSLRDSERFTHRRHAFDLAEFRGEWAAGHGGANPSKAVEDFYFSQVELNNLVWGIKADKAFKQAVDEGNEVLKWSLLRRDGETDELSAIVNRVSKDSIPEGELVFNPITREVFELEKLGNRQVFRVARGGVEANDGKVAVYLTTENPSVRRVYHSDVFGYNAGGPRGYELIRHFVKQTTRVNLLNGKEVVGKARTFMGTATREEAKRAADEINAMLVGFRKMVPGLNDMSMRDAISAIEGLAKNAGARALVKANGSWNNNIQSVQDFVDFMRKQKLDPTRNMGIAQKDEVMAEVDDAGNAIFGALPKETYGDDFERSINIPKNSGPRKDQPVFGFGGNFAETTSPLDGIQSDFMRAVHSRAFEAFNTQAIEGWLRGAKPHMTPASQRDIRGLSPLQALKKADFPPKGSEEALAYNDARNAILRTLGDRNKWDLKWDAFTDRVGEYVYGKGWERTGKFALTSKVAKSPLTFLRGLTFDAFLGLLDPGQLIVQASQTANIVAIAGIKNGFRGAANWAPLRAAMLTDDADTLLEIGRRASALNGMEAEDFVRLQRWVKDSGRLNVGDEVAETSSVSNTMAKSNFRKVRDMTRFFFNEGEKVPRAAAISVAWREFGEQFPKLDAFDEFGVNWITSRQNALTAGMTRANAAAWQQGPTSLPLQFMTYSSRMLESLFTNRLLTKAERLRLGTMQVAFYGASGVGAGALFDGLMLENGWELDETTYELLKFGALDASLNATFGTQAVFGGRLAMAEGFTDMIRNFKDKSILEVISGPAGQLGSNVLSVAWQTAVDAVNGDTELLSEDLERFARQFTGPNKAYNSWAMFTMGEYLSRNDDVLVNGLTNTDALLHTFGGQIRDANLAFNIVRAMKDEDEHLKTYGKDIARRVREAQEAMDAGDFDKANAINKQIGAMIVVLEPHQYRKIQPSLDPQLDSMFNSLLFSGTIRRNFGRVGKAAGDN